jgi:hypothetical protein
MPALEEAMKKGNDDSQNIVENQYITTFKNTIEALNYSGTLLTGFTAR